MHLADRDLILTVAWEVRWWCEAHAAGMTHRRFDDPAGDEDLNGYCAIASARLWRALAAHGITAEVHIWQSPANECHVFLVVDDHVLDVTATQFRELRNTPVVLMHAREADAYEYYHSTTVLHSAGELRLHQQRTDWESTQIAFPE